jgi:hypothetical protein
MAHFMGQHEETPEDGTDGPPGSRAESMRAIQVAELNGPASLRPIAI